jgi:hypothetical protein
MYEDTVKPTANISYISPSPHFLNPVTFDVANNISYSHPNEKGSPPAKRPELAEINQR